MRPELLLKLGQVAVFVHEPQHPAEDGRETLWQPVHSAEVQHTQPPVGQQPEVARVRIGVRSPTRSGPENRKRIIMMPARSRSAAVPPAMILASGMPSSHSLTSTWSLTQTTPGTQTSGSPA